MISKLKQPKKYAHSSLNKDTEEDGSQGEKDGGYPNQAEEKTKKISKLHDKKTIKKKFEPSAIRLAAIN